MIYRAAKVQKIYVTCKRLRLFLLKKSFLYVIQHKIGAYACACEKKIVLLQATYRVQCARM